MAQKHLFVVDDEEDIIELISYNMAKEGYKVSAATSGENVIGMVESLLPDLIILDLMLPHIGGLELCRLIKSNQRICHIPIIMLTAKTEESDIVIGLGVGADDYITKPFSPKVLVARVKALLRRTKEKLKGAPVVIKINDMIIDEGKFDVTIHGKSIGLTFTEFYILKILAARPGWVFSRYQIVDAIRGDDYPVTDRSVDVQIAGLRKKLGGYGKNIETVRGVGYRFKQ